MSGSTSLYRECLGSSSSLTTTVAAGICCLPVFRSSTDRRTSSSGYLVGPRRVSTSPGGSRRAATRPATTTAGSRARPRAGRSHRRSSPRRGDQRGRQHRRRGTPSSRTRPAHRLPQPESGPGKEETMYDPGERKDAIPRSLRRWRLRDAQPRYAGRAGRQARRRRARYRLAAELADTLGRHEQPGRVEPGVALVEQPRLRRRLPSVDRLARSDSPALSAAPSVRRFVGFNQRGRRRALTPVGLRSLRRSRHSWLAAEPGANRGLTHICSRGENPRLD